MDELKLNGKQIFLGKEIPVIEGGFGEGKKVILAKTIAEIHEVRLLDINALIKENIEEFEDRVDIIDLKNSNDSVVTLLNLGFSKQSIANSRNIYLLSEQGYMLLASFMRTDKAKEIRKQFRREYFTMREVINNNNVFTFEMFSNTLPVMLETIMGTVGNAMVENNKHIYDEIEKVRKEGKNIINEIELKHEEQLRRTSDLIGLRSRNTKSITTLMKDKLSELKGGDVYAKDYHYTLLKNKLFLLYNVSTFEQIPVKYYNDIFATIDSLENIDDIIDL